MVQFTRTERNFDIESLFFGDSIMSDYLLGVSEWTTYFYDFLG